MSASVKSFIHIMNTHTHTHTHTQRLSKQLAAHCKMVIFLIAQAVDLCTHISEVPSCLSVFLPPGVEQCKFMSAAAPNSLVLNILSVCVHSVCGTTVHRRQYEPLWHHRARRYQLRPVGQEVTSLEFRETKQMFLLQQTPAGNRKHTERINNSVDQWGEASSVNRFLISERSCEAAAGWKHVTSYSAMPRSSLDLHPDQTLCGSMFSQRPGGFSNPNTCNCWVHCYSTVSVAALISPNTHRLAEG